MKRVLKTMRGALAGATVMAALCVAAPAQASTWTFTGNCEDCAAAAGTSSYAVTGELTLVDYVEGTDLTDANFVSFMYGGSNLLQPYVVTTGDFPEDLPPPYYHSFFSMTGNLTDGGSQSLVLNFGDGLEFTLDTAGNWFTCGTNGTFYYDVPCSWQNNADFGNRGSLTTTNNPVPAPAAAALFSVGVGAFGLVRRRRVR